MPHDKKIPDARALLIAYAKGKVAAAAREEPIPDPFEEPDAPAQPQPDDDLLEMARECDRLAVRLEKAEKERDDARRKLRANEEALLRMGDQLCDWQTRAIEAEQKVREYRNKRD